MSRLLHNRLFRFLVCLFVICCMLVNLSPIRAEAVAITATVAGTGIAATLFAMAMGVVFVDMTAELITRMGESMTTHLEKTTTDDEKDILKTWIEGIKVNLDTGEISSQPPDEDPDDENNNVIAGLLSIPEELMDNVVSWVVGLIKGDGVEVEDSDSVAPEGYAYYNGYCYPELKSEYLAAYPYVFLKYNSSSGSATFYYVTDVSHIYYNESSKVYSVSVTPPGRAVTISSSGSVSDTPVTGSSIGYCSPVWSLQDIFNYDGSLYISGSEPVPVGTQTTTVEPSAYVGDIPSGVQDGTIDEDDVKIQPVYFGDWITSTETAADEINAVATQLANGTMTYEDYMDMTEYKTDTSTDTGTDTGTDTEWQPPEDPGEFALDLSNVFPFCIPFDLYDFLTCLNADPVAPVIQWELALPGGGSYPIELDLSPFDSVAQLLRRLQLLLFCVALAIKTRDLIKG